MGVSKDTQQQIVEIISRAGHWTQAFWCRNWAFRATTESLCQICNMDFRERLKLLHLIFIVAIALVVVILMSLSPFHAVSQVISFILAITNAVSLTAETHKERPTLSHNIPVCFFWENSLNYDVLDMFCSVSWNLGLSLLQKSEGRSLNTIQYIQRDIWYHCLRQKRYRKI